jgi:hypothetical protein
VAVYVEEVEEFSIKQHVALNSLSRSVVKKGV